MNAPTGSGGASSAGGATGAAAPRLTAAAGATALKLVVYIEGWWPGAAHETSPRRRVKHPVVQHHDERCGDHHLLAAHAERGFRNRPRLSGSSERRSSERTYQKLSA